MCICWLRAAEQGQVMLKWGVGRWELAAWAAAADWNIENISLVKSVSCISTLAVSGSAFNFAVIMSDRQADVGLTLNTRHILTLSLQ